MESRPRIGPGALFALALLCLAVGGAVGPATAQPAPAQPAPAEPAAPQPAPTPIAIGETATAELAAGDATAPDASFYDCYVIEGTPGTTVTVTMRSTAFDTFLAASTTAAGCEDFNIGTELTVDDDGGGGPNGTDSQLVLTFDANGRFLIAANSYEPQTVGPYTLTVEGQAADTPPPKPATPAEPATPPATPPMPPIPPGPPKSASR